MSVVDRRRLYEWCRVPLEKLEHHPDRRVPFRLITDSAAMGELMARELVQEIEGAARRGEDLRAVIPCGPSSWYEPFTTLVNKEKISLRRFFVYHMDECLDWQGRELPRAHPYSFRGFMEKHFYGPVDHGLAVPEENRFWLTPATMEKVRETIHEPPSACHFRGLGPGRAHRLQPGPPASVQRDLPGRAGLVVGPDPGEQLGHDPRPGPTDIRHGMAVRAAAVGNAGRAQCLSAARVRLFSDTGVEADRAPCRTVFGAHSRVPDDPAPEPPRRLDHGHRRDGAPPGLDASGMGPGPLRVACGVAEPPLASLRFRGLVGTGGIGHGSFFLLDGNEPLGREESRSGTFLDSPGLLQAPHRMPLREGPPGRARGCLPDRTGGRRPRRGSGSAGRWKHPAGSAIREDRPRQPDTILFLPGLSGTARSAT